MYAVFDFDKTLTNHDTLFGFYRAANKKSYSFLMKRTLFLGVALFYKLKIINNDQLKKFGVFLFLKGKSREHIREIAKEYANQISLNNIYKNNFLKYSENQRIIISASFEDYLRFLFPNENVIASSLKYKNGIVVGIERNMFGNAKPESLIKEGINKIGVFYTDSFSDKPLMEYSIQVYLVKSGFEKRIK